MLPHLPPPLHPRLTVVRADAGTDPAAFAQRLAAALADAVVADDAGTAVDLRPASSGPVVLTAGDILGRALQRAAEAHARLLAGRDEAVAQRSRIAARRTRLLERADWCEANAGTARALLAALDEAAAAATAARAALDAAEARRDRVGEQRAAAQAAVQEARLELEALEGAALDETGVRRGLEAATRTEQEATAALAAAEAEVASLRARIDELDRRRSALEAERAALLEAEQEAAAAAEIEAAVADALAYYDEMTAGAPRDLGAAALAEDLAQVEAGIAELTASVPNPPTAAELAAAEDDLRSARRRLDAARNSASSFDGPPPPWWAELTALHAAVVDAETALQTASLRKSAARKRYEDALAAERAHLDALGFASYLDALMSGGRLPSERAGDEAAIAGATEALAAAERRFEQLRAAHAAAAPLATLAAERERLVGIARQILGCDPGDRAAELLNDHPSVSPMVIETLAAALADAGIDATARGVAAAAREWLEARAGARDAGRLAAVDAELAAATAERQAAEQALGPATARAERAAEEAAAAGRTVASLEAELRARAGDDARLFERASAARALQEQVQAVEARLAEADAQATQDWAAAAEAATAAEAERDRIERQYTDLSRRAQQAAAELPSERRPAFELPTNLVSLAGALRAEAGLVADDLARADHAVADAETACGTGPLEPTAEDLVTGLLEALADGAGRGAPLVLAEPLAGVPSDEAEDLLAVVADASADVPTVVVTTDLTVAGWAIGLPAEVGALLPARSLGALVDPDHAAATSHPRVD